MACNSERWFSSLALLVILQSSVHSQLTGKLPHFELIATVKETVRFICRTSNHVNVHWLFTPVNPLAGEIDQEIYNGKVFSPKYARHDLNKSSCSARGVCDLVVSNIRISDAGSYKCKTMENGSSKTSTLELIVFDQPSCHGATEVIVEGKNIDLTSDIVFSGNSYFKPTVHWWTIDQVGTRSDAFGNVFIYPFDPERNSRSFDVNSTLTLKSHSDHNMKSFLCDWIIYGNHSIPLFNSNCTVHNNLTILYGPKNVRIEPSLDVYNPGDRLLCRADGNPNNSTYEWHDAHTGTKLTSGPKLVIEKTTDLDREHEYYCLVSNGIGSNRKDIKFRITHADGETWDRMLVILLPTAVLVAILFVVICVMFFCMKRRKQSIIDSKKESTRTVSIGDSSSNSSSNSRHVYDSIEIPTTTTCEAVTSGETATIGGAVTSGGGVHHSYENIQLGIIGEQCGENIPQDAELATRFVKVASSTVREDLSGILMSEQHQLEESKAGYEAVVEGATGARRISPTYYTHLNPKKQDAEKIPVSSCCCN